MRAPGFSRDVDFSISENWLFCSHGDFWLLRLMFGHSAQPIGVSHRSNVVRSGCISLGCVNKPHGGSRDVHVNSVNWDSTKILGIAGVLDHQSLHLTLGS